MLTSIRTTSGCSSDGAADGRVAGPRPRRPPARRAPSGAARAGPGRNASWSSAMTTRIAASGAAGSGGASASDASTLSAAARSVGLTPGPRAHDGVRAHVRTVPPSGSRATTRVPPSAWRSTRSSPPSSAARALIDSRPVPGTKPVGLPRPSSVTSIARSGACLDQDAAGPRLGVPHRIRHRLDRDPVGGNLDRGRQLGQRRGLAVDRDPRRRLAAAPLEPPRLLVDRRDQAELVERRRSKAVDEAADVGERDLHLARSARPAAGAPRRDRSRSSRRTPRRACRSRRATDPSPSWRSRRSRRRSSSRARTRCSRERTRSSRSRIACTAAPAWRPRSSSRPSSSLRKPRSPGRTPSTSRPAVSAPWTSGTVVVTGGATPWTAATTRSPRLVDDLEGDERQPQRLGDGLDDGGEGPVGLGRPLQPLPEPAHRPPRLVALAVHEPVHRSLEHVAQRQRHERGEAGGQQRDPIPVLRAGDRAEQRHRDGVAGDHPERQAAVDERPVDDDLDVEQPVEQDPGREAERHRQRDQADPARRDERLADDQLRALEQHQAEHGAGGRARAPPSGCGCDRPGRLGGGRPGRARTSHEGEARDHDRPAGPAASAPNHSSVVGRGRPRGQAAASP